MPIRYLSIKEFRELGFLQEANRLFFHPHGLALEMRIDEDGTECLSGVWDYRDDPEGITFGAGVAEPDKARAVARELEKHRAAREALFGAVIQPIDANPSHQRERT